MTTFKAYLKKEFIEGIRQYKYIALATGIILFSILDPVMLKLLPSFVGNKIPANLIHQLFEFKPKDALANYIKDLFQIGTLFVIFTAAGSINEEIYSQKIVFPFSKGANKSQIVLAKYLHFAIAICFLLFVGLFFNQYYANLLFEGQKIAVSDIVSVYFLLCIYYLFVISLTLFFSSFTKKNISAGILACTLAYSTALLSQFEKLKKFSPYNLVLLTSNFGLQDAKTTLVFTLLLAFLFLVTTIIRFNSLEVN
ncbi:ABC transporter permease [Caldicellulosiruptor acetigenus]|uniref:ABC transporter permease n=1 Tax=Caldicellulosiruptor acetigenus TaxID=301953 RepID=UPI0003FB8294|nr:ABC transporter permease subunit [Caldicellulosiruptor acetigenus]WAM37197.1 ABC transporter permease subunit [Caldicellulosiruptor acetigenus]